MFNGQALNQSTILHTTFIFTDKTQQLWRQSSNPNVNIIKCKQRLEQVFVHSRSSQHCLQQPKVKHLEPALMDDQVNDRQCVHRCQLTGAGEKKYYFFSLLLASRPNLLASSYKPTRVIINIKFPEVIGSAKGTHYQYSEGVISQ